MARRQILRSLFIVGICASAVTLLPGSGVAEQGRVAARPGTGEPPSKPLTSSTGVTKDVEGLEASAVTNGLVFVPVNPYRTLDSRAYPDGLMVGGDSWYFDVLTTENGMPVIPATAEAVTYNLTVTGTYGWGYCALYPADINWPGNSSINWTQNGQSIANGGTVAIGFWDAPGQVEIYCGPNATAATDFIVDITGYYVVPNG